MNKFDEAMQLLNGKVGNKDGLISLSTIAIEPGTDGKSRPAARIVDAYYEDGAFYIVTYATTSKVIISILVLRETLTWMSVLGMALSLAGLFISEYRGRKANANK